MLPSAWTLSTITFVPAPTASIFVVALFGRRAGAVLRFREIELPAANLGIGALGEHRAAERGRQHAGQRRRKIRMLRSCLHSFPPPTSGRTSARGRGGQAK